MSASLYTHLPLTQPDKQIRLLRLEPPSPEHDNYIFSLAVHDFDETNCPPYIAISYTWGLPVGLLPIFVNGHKIKAHFNCWFALWQMRHHGYTGQNFWIDSLCINQGDDNEKSVQVAMMGSIFSSATWVASCIGTGDGIGSLRDVLESPDYNTTREASDGIAKLPYFERVWIKQEIILAQEVRLFSGTDEISWTEFSRISTLAEMREGGSSDPSGLSLPDFGTGTEETNTQHVGSQRPTKWRTFPELAFFYRTAKATDPKDKIYALLPLLPKDDVVRQHLPIVYGRGTSLSLLRTLTKLVYGGYWSLTGPLKNDVLILVAGWLQSDLAEDAISCVNLQAFCGGPRLGTDDEYVKLNMLDLRMLHKDIPCNQGSKYSFRVEAEASTSLDTEGDYLAYTYDVTNGFTTNQDHRLPTSSIPRHLKAMKVVYRYFDEERTYHPRPGARTALFYVNADVRPGDVILLLEYSYFYISAAPRFPNFVNAILRPTHAMGKRPRAGSSSREEDEGISPYQPMYVFHSWAVPTTAFSRLTGGSAYACTDSHFKSKSSEDAHMSCSSTVMAGHFRLHYQDTLRYLVSCTEEPLHSLLHLSTENRFGMSSGMSSVVDTTDSTYESFSAVLEKQKRFLGNKEAR